MRFRGVLAGLILTLYPPPPSVAQPSPAAPLTGTASLAESSPHLNGSGEVCAYGASSELTPSAARIRLDLRGACCDRLQAPLALSDPGGIVVPVTDLHPSLSKSGDRVALWRSIGNAGHPVPQSEIAIHDFSGPLPSVTVLTDSSDGTSFPFNIVDGTGPRPHLSGEGATVWYTTGPVNLFPLEPLKVSRHDIATDVRVQDTGDYTLARTQSATTDSGTTAVIVHRDAGLAVVRLSGAPLQRTLLTPRAVGLGAVIEDATQSGTGANVAWVSNWNHCTGAAATDSDLWIWTEEDWPAASPNTCAYAGGTLVRLPGDGSTELIPAITRDGTRLFFLSNANFGAANPLGAPVLWFVSFPSSSGFPVPQWVASEVDLANPERVIALASPNGDGTLVAYEVLTSLDPYRSDLRLVHVDDPGVSAIPSAVGPSHLPMEVEISDCTQVMGQTRIEGSIRSYNNGTRNVILRYAVDDGVTVRRAGPHVQQVVALGSASSANVYYLDVLVDAAPAMGTCSITAIDASAVQPDVVEARRAFP